MRSAAKPGAGAACRGRWAVDERGIVRVEWRTNARNDRSIAVAQRLGMRRDGTLRQAFPGGAGGRIDLEIWSVLADEWRARRAGRPNLLSTQEHDVH